MREACIEYASLYADPADYPALLDPFGLDPLKKSFVSKLSGGERQKLSVVARREVWKTLKRLKDQAAFGLFNLLAKNNGVIWFPKSRRCFIVAFIEPTWVKAVILL